MKTNDLGKLLGDVRLLLILFVAFRFTLLIAYQPFFIGGGERGIGTGGDRLYHYALASFADDGLLPFRDWWSEFPPVWSLTTTGVYLLLGENASYDNWSLLLGVLVIASEAGVLLLLRALGTRLHGEGTGTALAWVYALLAAPAVHMWWNFDTLVTLFLLLGIWLLLKRRDVPSVLVVTLGALTKFVPFLLFGAVLRFLPLRRAVRYLALSVGLFALAYLPLLALNSEMTLISLTAQFGKPSYQTVWALLDQNYTTGNFGSAESHLRVEGVDEGIGARNPARIPGWLRLGVAAAVGLAVFLRTRRMDERGFVAFVGITFLIFYLQSQGWSPQWVAQILPLLLLIFPTRNGVLVAVMLSLLVFIEYPFLFIRTGDGILAPGSALFLPWVAVILLRTALLVGLCIAYDQVLRQEPDPQRAIARKSAGTP